MTLPAILSLPLLRNLVPIDGSSRDLAWSQFLSRSHFVITAIWCVILFFVLNRVACWIEIKRGIHDLSDDSNAR